MRLFPDGDRLLLWSWALVGLLVVLFQLGLPIVSDEAYFISWGKFLSPGFYDHPPLPGWISFVLWRLEGALGLAHHGGLFRLFAVLLGGASLGLVALRLRGLMAGRRARADLLVLLALIPGYLLMFNLYLNDTILAFASLVFLLTSEAAMRARRHVWAWVIGAGLAFGAVLLTKYTGAVVYLGMVAGLLTWRAGRRFLFGRMVLISLVAAVPFGWHLWWNYNHCAVNLGFNFAFRNSRATGYGPLWVGLTLLVMAGPAGVLALWPRRSTGMAQGASGFFRRTFFGTLLVMLVISVLRREFGVNWGAPLGFLAILALAEAQPQGLGARARLLALGLCAVVLLPVAGLFLGLKSGVLPAARYLSPRDARAVTMNLDLADGSLARALAPYAAGRVGMFPEYGIRAAFDNASDIAPFQETTVASRSPFGRNQDLFTDFRSLAGREVLWFDGGQAPDMDIARRLFRSFDVVTVKTRRAAYGVILGHGFRYQAFKKDWISPVIKGFYDKSGLPWGRCYMDKYRP